MQNMNETQNTKEKRGRGRPRKMVSEVEQKPKGKRGRPRKYPISEQRANVDPINNALPDLKDLNNILSGVGKTVNYGPISSNQNLVNNGFNTVKDYHNAIYNNVQAADNYLPGLNYFADDVTMPGVEDTNIPDISSIPNMPGSPDAPDIYGVPGMIPGLDDIPGMMDPDLNSNPAPSNPVKDANNGGTIPMMYGDTEPSAPQVPNAGPTQPQVPQTPSMPEIPDVPDVTDLNNEIPGLDDINIPDLPGMDSTIPGLDDIIGETEENPTEQDDINSILPDLNVPQTPQQPVTPEIPQVPEAPSMPGMDDLSIPDLPGLEPEMPLPGMDESIPGLDDVASNMQAPEIPTAPEAPSMPGMDTAVPNIPSDDEMIPGLDSKPIPGVDMPLPGVENTTIPGLDDISANMQTPEIPQVSQEPVVPQVPKQPVMPQKPVAPQVPEQPVMPQEPVAPQVPKQPVMPQEPVVPQVPEQPVTPEEPSIPGLDDLNIPDLPGMENTVPGLDMNQPIPGMEDTTIPGMDEPIPGLDDISANMQAPEIPQAPEQPVVPETPVAPEVPVASQVSEQPVVPEMPADDEMIPGLDSEPIPGDETNIPGLDTSEPTTGLDMNQPLPGMEDSTIPGMDEPIPGLDMNQPLPGMEDTAMPGMDEPIPGLDMNQPLPGMEDSTMPGMDEPIPGLDLNQPLPGMDIPGTDAVSIPGLDELDNMDPLEGLDMNMPDAGLTPGINPSVVDANLQQGQTAQSYYNDYNANTPNIDESQINYNAYDNNNTFASTQAQSLKPKVDYSMSTFNGLLTSDKKVVTFIGTTKNGTSFLVNNLAALFSSIGINTAILDMTKNKNSYYIYTKNEEELRKIAYTSIEDLRSGRSNGLHVDHNLTVYTALPNDGKDYSNAEQILSTIVQNHSVVLIDCDYSTDPSYFALAQEIYLVQSLDILTIQPLTAFLRDLKTQGVLEPEKIRVVINKNMRVGSLTTKLLIGGMSFYNDPAMSFMTELFNKDMVKYCEIPFDEKAYAKYLESMVNCNVSLSGYSQSFIAKLKTLGEMVYPLISKQSYGKPNAGFAGNTSVVPGMK